MRWRDGKAVFKAATEPPADIVALIDARKAEISAFLHPEAVQCRLDAEAEVLRAPRPPDVSDGHWEVALRGLRSFIELGYGDEALRLGWPPDELYAVPPVWSRVDLCGVGLAIGDRQVVSITPTEIRIKTPSGGTLAFYRKPAVDYRVAYEAHLKPTLRQLQARFRRGPSSRARAHGRSLPQQQSQRQPRGGQGRRVGRHCNQGDDNAMTALTKGELYGRG